MARQDEEMSDIVVVVDDTASDRIDPIADAIKAAGGRIEEINRDEGVIEGALPRARLKEIQALPGIKYVRDVYNYTAESGNEDDPDEQIPR